MQFLQPCFRGVSHFCAEERGWVMFFLSTTFPNAPAHPLPPILFNQSLMSLKDHEECERVKITLLLMLCILLDP